MPRFALSLICNSTRIPLPGTAVGGVSVTLHYHNRTNSFPLSSRAASLGPMLSYFHHMMGSFEKQALWSLSDYGQCFHNPSDQKLVYSPAHSFFCCSGPHCPSQSLCPLASGAVACHLLRVPPFFLLNHSVASCFYILP